MNTPSSGDNEIDEYLSDCERKFYAIFDNSPFGIFLVKEKTILDCNDKACQILGYSQAELTGKTFHYITHPDDQQIGLEEVKQLYSKEIESFELEKRYIHKSGKVIWAHLNVSIIKNNIEKPLYSIAQLQDITDKKLADEALRDSEDRWRTLVQNAPEIVATLNRNHEILFINRTDMNLSPEEVMGRNILDFTQDMDRDMVKSQIDSVFNTGKPASYQVVIPVTDGEDFWYTTRVAAIKKNDVVDSVIFITVNISDIKKAESALRESELRYRSLHDNIPMGIFRATINNEILSANPTMVRMFGYGSEVDILGQSLSGLFMESSRRDELQKLIMENTVLKNFEFEGKRKDHSGFWGSLSMRSVLGENGESGYIDGILEDITEKKKLKEDIINQDRMESLSMLAAGIAHDLNNYLTGLSGSIELMKLISGEAEIQQKLVETEGIIRQTKKLSRQLSSFSRGVSGNKEEVNLMDIVKESAEIALAGSNLAFDLKYTEDIYPIFADPSQISQLVNNLVLNAKDATRDSGKIEIVIERELSQSAEGPGPQESDFVRFSVRDYGIGISEDISKKVFDPYFSTKEKGSGFGLSSCYFIVNNHGGTISFESRQGEGSTFTVSLPLTDEIKITAKETEKKEIINKKNSLGKKILLMDDDRMILGLAKKILEKFGYVVITSEDGYEALESYQKSLDRGEKIDLVILDLTIPGGMGGRETIKKLYEMDPNVRAIISSGNIEHEIVQNYRDYHFLGCLLKPYNLKELTEVVEKVLLK